ncbi:MAG: hypothetical protein RL238_98 [Actinomycetota bacterium]|jgi:hypothetical protein
MSPVQEYWDQMVTVALLGTDRREPPAAPPGGLADLAADQPLPTASQRLLQQVAATAVVRRAGVQPGPVAEVVAPPDADPRPLTPPSATATWHRVVSDWPVLEDEWVLTVVRNGHRLAPELVPPLLARHRADGVRHARVRAAAGPLADWMISWSPRLACTSKQRVVPELVAEVPELPITPDLVGLLSAPPARVAEVVAGGLSSGALAVSHRPVLVNLVARVQPAALEPLAVALDRVDPSRSTIGIALALADLARLRHHLLTELEPA